MNTRKRHGRKTREIRELIRVKIDITGLREEDIAFLRNEAKSILEQSIR